MAKVIGVDFDSESVRAAEVSGVGKGSPRVERYGEVPLPTGAVVNGEVVEPNTVADALRTLWATQRFSTRAVALGVGSQRVIARPLTVDDGTREMVRAGLPIHAEAMLPFPADEALMDFYPIERPEGQPGKVRGLLVAAARDAIDDNVRTLRRARLLPDSVDLVAFALARTHLRDAEGTVALVEIGASATNVLIAVDSIPQFLRIIPSGTDEMLRNLSTITGLPEEELAGPVRSGSFADAQALADATASLSNSIANTLDYYANSMGDAGAERILLAGRGGRMPHTLEQLQARTRRPVTLADPLAGVRLGKNVDPHAIANGSPGVAIGLALGGAA